MLILVNNLQVSSCCWHSRQILDCRACIQIQAMVQKQLFYSETTYIEMEHSTSGVQLDLCHKCFIRPSCHSVMSCWDKDSSNKVMCILLVGTQIHIHLYNMFWQSWLSTLFRIFFLSCCVACFKSTRSAYRTLSVRTSLKLSWSYVFVPCTWRDSWKWNPVA